MTKKTPAAKADKLEGYTFPISGKIGLFQLAMMTMFVTGVVNLTNLFVETMRTLAGLLF